MGNRKLKLGAGIASFAMFLVMLASIMIVAYNYVQGTKLARERTKSYVETVLLHRTTGPGSHCTDRSDAE